MYIGFIANKKNICDCHLYKDYLKIWINLRKGELIDPKNITRDVSQTGHWGNGDYQLQISNDDNLEYIMSLIKESYLKIVAIE
jgi:predicted transport protein